MKSKLPANPTPDEPALNAHFQPWDIGRILSALAFAAERHRRQVRKGRGATPYINHPVRVADLLWNVGGVHDVDILAAAILHDTIEDTDATVDELERLFGRAAAAYVLEVSDDKSLPKAERKRLQVEHASRLSRGARLIKLADKIANVSDLDADPPPDWNLDRRQEYLDWSARVAAGLRGLNPPLESMFDQVLAIGRAKLGLQRQAVSSPAG
jgi:guanosine-3',5'-bis(diphosphate) 3'-pyrophosphohydrolase